MRLRRAVAASLVFGVVACARTGLLLPDDDDSGQGTPTPVDECAVDADCATGDPCVVAACGPEGSARTHLVCQTTPVSCDDGDVCTLDRCDGAAGGCVHERPVDADHDGFVGQAPDGVPASCGGQDCDDTDPAVHPGAPELCDSKDNDCNGAIDEGFQRVQVGGAVVIAPAMKNTQLGSLVFDGTSYAVTYTAATAGFQHTQGYFELLDAGGHVTAGPTLVSDINADSFSGSVAFSGKSFLSAWADARQAANYEIYSTRFNQKAEKLEADQRLTDANGFSLRPQVRFTGSEYVVIWEDQRFEARGGPDAIFGHRLTEEGAAAGDEVRLTGTDEDADFAAFAATDERLGVAYVVEDPSVVDGTIVRFRTFDLTLGDATASVDLGIDGQEPVVESVGDHFVVAWHTGTEGANWGGSILAATLDGRGTVIASGPVTFGDVHAKTRALLSLGDRAFLVWSAVDVEGSPFSLFYQTFTANTLEADGARQLLARSANGFNLTDPYIARGPDGALGIVYDEDVTYTSYFMTLGCIVR